MDKAFLRILNDHFTKTEGKTIWPVVFIVTLNWSKTPEKLTRSKCIGKARPGVQSLVRVLSQPARPCIQLTRRKWLPGKPKSRAGKVWESGVLAEGRRLPVLHLGGWATTQLQKAKVEMKT